MSIRIALVALISAALLSSCSSSSDVRPEVARPLDEARICPCQACKSVCRYYAIAIGRWAGGWEWSWIHGTPLTTLGQTEPVPAAGRCYSLKVPAR